MLENNIICNIGGFKSSFMHKKNHIKSSVYVRSESFVNEKLQ